MLFLRKKPNTIAAKQNSVHLTSDNTAKSKVAVANPLPTTRRVITPAPPAVRWTSWDLCMAIRLRNMPQVQCIVDSGTVSLNATDGNGWSPLSWSCDVGTPSMVQLLLERKADPCLPDGWDKGGKNVMPRASPVVWAVRAPVQLPIQDTLTNIRLLAAHGVDMNGRVWLSEQLSITLFGLALNQRKSRRPVHELAMLFHCLLECGCSPDLPAPGAAVGEVNQCVKQLEGSSSSAARQLLAECLNHVTVLPVPKPQQVWAMPTIKRLRYLVNKVHCILLTNCEQLPNSLREMVLAYSFGRWEWLDDVLKSGWSEEHLQCKRRVEEAEDQLRRAQAALQAVLKGQPIRLSVRIRKGLKAQVVGYH